MEKIDMHCHVLPSIDDGPAKGRESLLMLEAAYQQGIRSVIATPHASPRYPNSRPAVIKRLCTELEEIVHRKLSSDFSIYVGQEILFSDSVLEGLQNGELLTLGESFYVLLEFFPSTPYSLMYRAVREFCMTAYSPVLAHIERYEALREEGRVEELIEIGAYMQMNYRIIGGKWYEPSVRWCRRMLQAGNVHFLGTDMHNTTCRAPETKAAEAWMERHLDRTYMEQICRENVRKVLLNERI